MVHSGFKCCLRRYYLAAYRRQSRAIFFFILYLHCSDLLVVSKKGEPKTSVVAVQPGPCVSSTVNRQLNKSGFKVTSLLHYLHTHAWVQDECCVHKTFMLLFWNSIWKGEEIESFREKWQCFTQRCPMWNLKIGTDKSRHLLHVMPSVCIKSETVCKHSIWIFFFTLPIVPTNCYHQP